MDGVVHQLTGNGYIPHLNVLHPSNYSTKSDKFFSRNYLPLKSHRFEVIHIFLRANCGKEITVQPSETQVFLHFRLKNGQ